VETPSAQPAISIAGCGAVTALGSGVEPLEKALLANASGLRPCEKLAGKGYQSTVAGMVPEKILDQLRSDDPAHADARAFLLVDAVLQQAEKSAAAVLKGVPPSRRGLVLSTTKADIEALERAFRREPCSTAARRHIQPALLAADVAAAREIRGVVQCVSAACISGLLAIQQGATLIRRGQADLVFVAGVDLVSHFVLSGFTTLKSLDPEGCRPFDRARVGLSLGEGAGALVLVRQAGELPDSILVRGWGTSNDANHLTGPSRDGSGLAMAISRALAKAGVSADQIDYVHTHGTGTVYNDAMESHALRAVFGERVPPFSSCKGMLGHTLGAAGILETILCQIAMRVAMLPGTPRLREPDPGSPSSLLANPQPATRLRTILKVNCGFGGTNAAVVLQKCDE
jgi:3-oxoacyl-[acyl-carrier-protein] synthase II